VAEGEPVVIPRLRTDVNVTVDGIVAHVEVRQRFRNPSEQWAEGIYAFPVPAAARVERISTVQDGKLVSDVRRKVRSQQLYDSVRAGAAQRLGSNASSGSLFRAPIADIAPRATVDITLGYVQILDHSLDRHQLRVPLAANLQPIPDLSVEGDLLTTPATADGWLQIADVATPARQKVAGGQALSVRVRIDASAPVTAIISRHHAIQVTQGTPATITASTEQAAADEDFVLEWSPDTRQTRMPLARAEHSGARLLPISTR
jgi:Ca-activated chloride channel family protein